MRQKVFQPLFAFILKPYVIFCTFRRTILHLHDDIRKCTVGRPHEILRRNLHLGSSAAAANHDLRELLRALVQNRRELLLHADAGAAAPHITGEPVSYTHLVQFLR